MLVVKPVEDKSYQEELCREAGVRYNPDAMAYVVYVDTFTVGMCQFGLSGDTGTIYSFMPIGKGKDDTEAMFIMGRTVLSFIESCGMEYADITEAETTERLKYVIGFKEGPDGRFVMRIKGIFEHHCNGN